MLIASLIFDDILSCFPHVFENVVLYIFVNLLHLSLPRIFGVHRFLVESAVIILLELLTLFLFLFILRHSSGTV